MQVFPFPSRSRITLAAVLVASACAVHAGPERPFKSSLELEHRVGRLTKCAGDQGQPGSGGTLHGSGHATHLGAVELQSSHCVALRPDQSLYLSNGEMRLTAANGDVVLADYAGYLTLVAPGVYAFEGNYFIKDGTGRFQEASGTGAMTGTLKGDFSNNPQGLALSLQGRISY